MHTDHELLSLCRSDIVCAQVSNTNCFILCLQGRRPNNGVWGTDVGEDVELDKHRLDEALRKLDERDKKQVEVDDRKRKYNSMQTDGEMPTEEEMEAYRMKKARDEDPMAKIIALKAAANTNYDFV